MDKSLLIMYCVEFTPVAHWIVLHLQRLIYLLILL